MNMEMARWIAGLIVHGNLFISLCAAALTCEWYLLTGNPVRWEPVLFVFLATFSQYNLQRLILIRNSGRGELSDRQRWIENNRSLLVTLLIFSLPCAGMVLFSLNYYQGFIAVLSGILSVFYFYPSGGMRKIPFLKGVLIALTWAMATVLIPAYEYGPARPGWIFLSCFLFILALAWQFDLRDREQDRGAGIRTLALAIGVNGIKFASLTMLALSLFTALNHGASPLFAVAYIPAAAVILLTTDKRGEWYYGVLTDGLILLKPLAAFFLYQNSTL